MLTIGHMIWVDEAYKTLNKFIDPGNQAKTVENIQKMTPKDRIKLADAFLKLYEVVAAIHRTPISVNNTTTT